MGRTMGDFQIWFSEIFLEFSEKWIYSRKKNRFFFPNGENSPKGNAAHWWIRQENQSIAGRWAWELPPTCPLHIRMNSLLILPLGLHWRGSLLPLRRNSFRPVKDWLLQVLFSSTLNPFHQSRPYLSINSQGIFLCSYLNVGPILQHVTPLRFINHWVGKGHPVGGALVPKGYIKIKSIKIKFFLRFSIAIIRPKCKKNRKISIYGSNR
jgi:hypothetical protein